MMHRLIGVFSISKPIRSLSLVPPLPRSFFGNVNSQIEELLNGVGESSEPISEEPSVTSLN